MNTTEIDKFIETRFGHLEGRDRQKAIQNHGAHNLIELTELCEKGEKQLLTPDEIESLQTCRDFENWTDNEYAVMSADDMLKKQRHMRAAQSPEAKPENKREFEAFLKSHNFSARESRRIASQAF